MKRVLVTGASGFVGRAVVRSLAARGWQVTALVRRELPVPGASTVVRAADLHDRVAMRRAVAGVQAVVHLAARVHVMREAATDPLAAFREVNVDGTRILLELSRDARAAQFVYVSSIKVHGEGRDRPYRATDPLNPSDPYGQSKSEAEALVTDTPVAELGWSIIRPPLVYGPGVGGNFLRLLGLADRARTLPLPLGGIGNRRSLVFVENLADAIGAMLHSDGSVGRRYLVSDGEDLSTSELIARLAVAMGGRARLVACPVAFLRVLARLVGRGSEVERLLGSLTVDATPLAHDLGWHAPVAVNDALGITARWWREANRR
jgi:nucleoside-diphosphate-sugar epimerase